MRGQCEGMLDKLDSVDEAQASVDRHLFLDKRDKLIELIGHLAGLFALQFSIQIKSEKQRKCYYHGARLL